MVASSPLVSASIRSSLSTAPDRSPATSLAENSKASQKNVPSTVQLGGPKSPVGQGGMDRHCCCGPSIRSCLLSWGIVLVVVASVDALDTMIRLRHMFASNLLSGVLRPGFTVAVSICVIVGVVKRNRKLLKVSFWLAITNIILLMVFLVLVWVHNLRLVDFEKEALKNNTTVDYVRMGVIITLIFYTATYIVNLIVTIIVCVLTKYAIRTG